MDHPGHLKNINERCANGARITGHATTEHKRKLDSLLATGPPPTLPPRVVAREAAGTAAGRGTPTVAPGAAPVPGAPHPAAAAAAGRSAPPLAAAGRAPGWRTWRGSRSPAPWGKGGEAHHHKGCGWAELVNDRVVLKCVWARFMATSGNWTQIAKHIPFFQTGHMAMTIWRHLRWNWLQSIPPASCRQSIACAHQGSKKYGNMGMW